MMEVRLIGLVLKKEGKKKIFQLVPSGSVVRHTPTSQSKSHCFCITIYIWQMASMRR